MIDKLKKITDCKGKYKDIIGEDGILQLAKDGICPHYVLINPLTKEETIWFIPSELNEWYQNNYTTYREGEASMNYKFLYFNQYENKATGQIPDELVHIKNLYSLPIEYISTPPGIYFLCKGKKIQYIGQAVNVSSRIINHISEGVKDFDSVFYVICPIKQLNELESALIKFYQPELNKTFKTEPSHDDMQIIELLHEFS